MFPGIPKGVKIALDCVLGFNQRGQTGGREYYECHNGPDERLYRPGAEMGLGNEGVEARPDAVQI